MRTFFDGHMRKDTCWSRMTRTSGVIFGYTMLHTTGLYVCLARPALYKRRWLSRSWPITSTPYAKALLSQQRKTESGFVTDTWVLGIHEGDCYEWLTV